jgi:hypothetical protein
MLAAPSNAKAIPLTGRASKVGEPHWSPPSIGESKDPIA